MSVRALWHRVWHDPVNDSMVERAPGEVFLRCTRCGLRSVGWQTGPLKVRSALPGDPERFRLRRPNFGTVEVVAEVAVPRRLVLVARDAATSKTIH